MRTVLAVVALTCSALVAPVGARAAAPYTITTHPSTTSPILGWHRVVFLGRVAPRAVGDYMVLQQRGSKTAPWRNERRTRIDSDGRFRLADMPTTMKARWYRVVKPATPGHAQIATRSWLVRVYRWTHLAEVPRRVEGDVNLDWPVSRTYEGAAYDHAFATRSPDEDARVQFDLDRRCRQARFWLALEEDSVEGAEARSELLSGDDVLWEATVLPGASSGISTIDVRGRPGLRLRVTRPDGAAPAEVVARLAEVLCTF